jgi:enoyl-CoA hydratase/carnithine racemase
VTLDDPGTRNALTDELLDALIGALELARADDEARVVVLVSSHDGIFSSGGNLKAFSDDRAAIVKYEGLSRFPRLFTLIAKLGKPVICAANGDVLAGAFGLALSCDLIIAKEGVRFGCPEVTVGTFPFMISALIYRNIPRMQANEIMYSGRLVTAERGREMGFVNAVVAAAEFDATVREWAGRLAAQSPLLMRLGKDALNATRDLPVEQALAALQSQLALAFTTEDIAEGVAAFREKRAPRWRGR